MTGEQPADGVVKVLEEQGDELLEEWLALYAPGVHLRSPNVTSRILREEGAEFVEALRAGLSSGEVEDLEHEAWDNLRALLTRLARRQLQEGFPVQEAGLFVTLFKEPLFRRLTQELGQDSSELAAELWVASLILDRLALRVAEVYLEHREEIIERQRQELLEVSTPVVKIWEGIVALPLVGTLDSQRTQIVMETLLEAIVKLSAGTAIIDITGVPTVDTQVAKNLMKTISAARLMGAECIISGIRPQIAQTIVQLGVHLEDIQSRSSLDDAIALAFRNTGRKVVQIEG